jgi:spectrin beta
LEEEIVTHKDRVTELDGLSKSFKEQEHFMADDLVERARLIGHRYKNLSEPCDIRRSNLEETLMLHQFYLDVEYELLWIHEKMPTAQSTDLGSTLTAVQNLVKKHQVR